MQTLHFKFKLEGDNSIDAKILSESLKTLPEIGSLESLSGFSTVVELLDQRRALSTLLANTEKALPAAFEKLRRTINSSWQQSEIPQQTQGLLNLF